MITLIVARAHNGAIGRDNDIPWFAPEDLKFFQRETMGGAIIMGRNTWDSLPFKPLKNRLNIVVTSKGVGAEHEVTSVEDAIELARKQGYQRLYAIGGASIYAGMMPFAHRMLITEVDLDVPDADTFFPDFDPAEWREIGRTHIPNEGPTCEAVEYLRRA